LQPTLYVHLIVSESNNGESVSEPRRHKPKRHNAKLCPFAIRQRIVNALANGDSIRAIARALRVSNNTVTAVAEQEWQQVEARKARIAAQAEQIATRAADLMLERLHNKGARDIPVNTLVPVFGVAVDKTLSLRGDASQTIRHIHSVDLTDDDLIAFAVARSKNKQHPKIAEDKVVQPREIRDLSVGGDAGDPSTRGEKRRAKRRLTAASRDTVSVT
jgi:hypothetical protein